MKASVKPSNAFDASLGLVLSWLYLPGLLNAAVVGRWAFAGLALALLAHTRPPLLALAWLAYAAASLLWSFDPWIGAGHLWWLAVLVLAMASPKHLSGMAYGTAIGILLQSPIILAQLFGWEGLAQVAPGPAALFLNKNFLAEAAALCAILMAMQSRPWLCFGLCLIVASTHCVEAELGLGLAALVWILRSYPWSTLALIAVLGIAAYITFDPAALAARDLGYRLVMWKAVLSHLTLWGHGLGSFYTLYPAWGDTHAFGRPDHPHNELVLAIFELGVGAILPVALGILAYVRCPIARPALALAACECAFGFPLQIPTTCVLIGLLAGAALRNDARAFGRVALRRGNVSMRPSRGKPRRRGF